MHEYRLPDPSIRAMVSNSDSSILFATDSIGNLYQLDIESRKLTRDYNNLHNCNIKAIEYVRNSEGQEFLCTGDLDGMQASNGGYLKIFTINNGSLEIYKDFGKVAETGIFFIYGF